MRLKVLVIDDDDEIREMVRLALGMRGHAVVGATGGAEGVDAAAAERPDLVLLDVMMPGMDGPETLLALRAREDTRSLPVAFLTASVTAREVERLRALGPVGVLAKPFDPLALAAEVEGLVAPTAARPAGDPGPPRVPAADGPAAEFDRLRQSFLARSRTQLEDAARLLAGLRGGREDRDALQALMRIFHRLAGGAGAFDLARAGALGKEGELTLLALLGADGVPPPGDVANIERLLAALDEVLGSAAGVHPEPVSAESAAGTFEAPHTVLIVDGDPEVRHVLAQLLANEGLIPLEAGSLAEASRAIERAVPDGVVTDAVLPDGDGCAFVEALRARHETENLPVIVLSPHAAFKDKVDAIHCGADALFDKPVEWKALLRRLQHLLDRSRPKPFRILSVEDDPVQAAFITRTLGAGGYEVRIVPDPAEFDAALRDFHPDLVTMDIVLPGISGYDLVRYLRQDERYVALPVLFLTTEGQLQSRFRTTRAGGDDHLVKPVPPPLLLAAVTARVERARFVRGLLDRDGLTRLLTHTALSERAALAHTDKARQPEREHTWVMLDVDHFKSVNDRFGHPVGDRVLAGLAALLRRRLRQTDTIGRYGGEEFAVLFDGLPAEEVVRLMDRVRDDFASVEHEAADGTAFRSSFSAGVAPLAAEMTVDAWRKAADDALYEAKKSGRNRVIAAH